MQHSELDAVRFHMAEEAKFSWLGSLLRAYALLDISIQQDIARSKRKPACGAGCAACCYQHIPLTHPEAMAIHIFLQSARPVVSCEGAMPGACGSAQDGPALPQHTAKNPCSFIASDGVCRIYPVRPFACRRFVVFDTPCAMGEDPTRVRFRDVLSPSRKAFLHALHMLEPFYAVAGWDGKGAEAVDVADVPFDFFFAHTRILQEIPWKQ